MRSGQALRSQTTDDRRPREHGTRETPLCECILPPRVPARAAGNVFSLQWFRHVEVEQSHSPLTDMAYAICAPPYTSLRLRAPRPNLHTAPAHWCTLPECVVRSLSCPLLPSEPAGRRFTTGAGKGSCGACGPRVGRLCVTGDAACGVAWHVWGLPKKRSCLGFFFSGSGANCVVRVCPRPFPNSPLSAGMRAVRYGPLDGTSCPPLLVCSDASAATYVAGDSPQA